MANIHPATALVRGDNRSQQRALILTLHPHQLLGAIKAYGIPQDTGEIPVTISLRLSLPQDSLPLLHGKRIATPAHANQLAEGSSLELLLRARILPGQSTLRSQQQ